MIRIERSSGFTPVASGRLAVRATLPAARTGSAPAVRLGQASSPEVLEIRGFLEEARRQLASIEENHTSLVVAIGREDADRAVAQARASVAMYEDMAP